MSMINQDDTNNSDNTSESKSDDQGNMKNDNDEESFDSSFVPESLRAFLDEANANLENTKASFDAQAIENKDGHVRIDGAMKYEGDQDDDSQIPSGEEPPQQQPQQLNNLHHDDDDDDDGTTNETRTTAARRSQDTSISNKDNDTKDNKLNSPFNSFEKKNKWNTDGDKNHNDVSSSDDGDDDDINIPYLQHVLSNTTSTVMYHQQQQQQHMNGSTRTPPPPLNRRNSYDDDDTDNSHYFLASSSDNSVSGAENRMGNNRKKGVHTRNSSGSGGGGGDSSDNHSENSSGLLQQPRGLALLTNEGSESTATAGAPSQEEQRLYQHHHHHHHHQNDRRQQQNNENDNNNSHNVLPTNHQHHEQRYRMVTPVFSAEQQQHPQYSSHPPPPPPHQQTQQQPSLPTHMLGGFVQQQLQQRIKTPPPPNNAYASSPDWNASLSSRESPHRAWKQQHQHQHQQHQQYMVDLQFSPDHLEYIDRRHQSPSPLEMEEAELATTPHENTGIESQQRPQDQQQYASLSNNSNKSSTIHGVAEGEKTDHDGPFALPLIPSMGTDSSRSQEQQQLQQQQQQQPLRYQPPLQSNGRHMQHQLQQYPQQQQHPHMMVPIKDDSLNSHPRMTATGERHNSEGDYAAGGGSSNSGEQQYPKNTISRDNNSPSTSSSPTLSQQERTNNFFENLQRESIGALQEAPPGEHAGGGDSDSRATPTPSEQAALQQQDEEGQQDQKQSGEADSTTEHEEVNNVNNGQQTPSSSSSSKPTSTSRRRRIFSTVDSVMRNVVSSVRAPRKSKKAKQQEEQQQEDVQQEQQQKLEDEEQPLINHQVEQNGFGGGGGGGGGGEGSFSAIELTLSISPDDNGAANINNNDTATLTQRIGTNNNHINDGDKQDGIAGKRFAPRFNEYKQRQARRLPTTSGRSSSSGYSSGGSNSGSGSYQSGDDKPIYSPPTMGQRNDEQKERQQHGSSERSSFLQQQQNNSDWWSVSESSLSSAGPSNIRGNHPRFTSSPAISTAFDRPSLEYQVQRGAQSARDLRSAHSNDAYYNDRNHLLESARRYSSSKSLNPQPNLFSPGQQSHASSDFSWISPHNNAPSNASRRATDDLYDRARAMSPLLGPCPSSSGSSRSARSRSGSSYSVCSRSSSGTETSGKYDDEDGEGLMTVQSFRARDPSDQQVLRQVVHNAPPLPQNPAAGVVGSMGLGIGTKFQNYRTRFTPEVQAEHATKYPTFICPNCGTKQREFFTVNTADLKETGPAAYMAIYFIIYVVASLYIFGLQEGWAALDCVYFAVITLTTAGLGDFVPTSDAAKVICSIFIYFGVATIGLLLGSYLAGSLDEASRKEARDRRAKNCRTCERMRIIKTQNEAMSRRSSLASHHSNVGGRRSTPDIHMRRPSPLSGLARAHSERLANCKDDYHRPHQAVYERGMNKPKHRQPKNADSSVSSAVSSARSHGSDNNIGLDMETVSYSSLPSTRASPAPSHDRNNVGDLISPVSNINPKDTVSPPRNPHALPPLGVIDEFSARSESHPSIAASQNGNRMHPPDSPSTGHILNRQRHTRHVSLDRKDAFELVSNIERNRNLRGYHTNRMPSPNLSSSWAPHVPSRGQLLNSGVDESSTSGSETTTSSSSFYSSDPSEESFLMADDVQNVQSRTKTAKYVFLTLKLAVTNSFLIIFIGSVGFYFIEKMTMVDSFYFTTTLLTTVGYGDIVPVTPPGKLFATIYVLGAGTVLLHNMSLISMIPLELRKRRIERAVLSQFGDQLDDAALRELATGPLVKRLQLSTRRYSALDECTREMFALAMLVRLGKVTEHDIRMTFAAFRKLDVNDDGVLDSQDIIVGMVRKRQASMGNLQAASTGQEMNTSRERTPAQSSTAWKWSGNPAPYYETAPQGGPFSQEYESESSCTEQEQSDREPLLQNDHHHGVQNNYSSVGLNIDYSPQHQPEPSFFLEQPPTMDMMNQPPQNLLSASSFCSEDVSRERHPQQQNASSFHQSYQGYFNSPFSAYSDRE